MAEFFTQLFESIFTPGPTPSLVIATNVSFAALQTLLLTLVIATYNVHFMVLSVLTAGLWWAINWFVRELEIAKAQNQEAKDKGSAQAGGEGKRKDNIAVAEDSGTETEDGSFVAGGGKGTGMVVDQARLKENMRLRVQNDAKARRTSGGDISGTDSEWDKVEVEEGEGKL